MIIYRLNAKILAHLVLQTIQKILVMGQNCTRLLNCKKGLNCTRAKKCVKTNLHKGTKLHMRTKLQEDKFAPRVNFARVTILHEGIFAQEKKTKNIKYI